VEWQFIVEEQDEVWDELRRASIEVVFNYTRNQDWRNDREWTTS
jgi:hypothetical protein